MNDILVLYYSRQGSTAALARQVCRGIESIAGMHARLRTVPSLTTTTERVEPAVPNDGPPYATHEDLAACSGLILRRPNPLGHNAAPFEVLFGRHERAVARRSAVRQTRGRLHLHSNLTRRAGIDLAVDDAAPAPSRH